MSVPAAAVLDLIDECGLDFSLAFRWDNHQLFFSAADLLMILPPIFKVRIAARFKLLCEQDMMSSAL